MDNASKNANEMIGKFSLLYNRYRSFRLLLIIELVKLSLLLSLSTSSPEQVPFSLIDVLILHQSESSAQLLENSNHVKD